MYDNYDGFPDGLSAYLFVWVKTWGIFPELLKKYNYKDFDMETDH